LRETQLILAHGLTIGGKSLREHFEVVNHRDAIAYVESLASGKGRITPFQVRQIHQLVLARIDDAEAGKFRCVNVRIAGASYAPPEPFDVPRLMDEWSRGWRATAPACTRWRARRWRITAWPPSTRSSTATAAPLAW
jgi:Fic family protein